ncbi:hypothetical protein [Kitasatospora sp. NPDC007106]|uniref:hypothetical protein n=1 Tax=Kitasatospora sp. NPDC007106 TaxID=3156914 RepID=UPI00340970E0
MINRRDHGQDPSTARRSIDPKAWSEADVPLLRAPRDFVRELHQRHLPQPGTTVVAVLDARHQLIASASFSTRQHLTDGWQHRNAILANLRQVVPHDLRLAAPVRTAVLLRCREGSPEWTAQDGAWMWALQDAAALHGLRCGSYIALAPAGWHVIGDGRRGRNPHSGSWSDGPLHTVTELPPRHAREPVRRTARNPHVAAVTALDALRPAASR